jgi:hypothetical protein
LTSPWKFVGSFVIGFFLLLFALIGFILPTGNSLECQKASQLCSLSYHRVLSDDDKVVFSFADVVDVSSKLTHGGRHRSFGVRILLQQGELIIDDVNPEDHAIAEAQKLKSYLTKPTLDSFTIDPKADYVHYLGMFACLIGGVGWFIRPFVKARRADTSSSKTDKQTQRDQDTSEAK